MQNIVILGAGTGGTMMANKLARTLDLKQWSITVVDRDNVHLYQPGLLLLPFGPGDVMPPLVALYPTISLGVFAAMRTKSKPAEAR